MAIQSIATRDAPPIIGTIRLGMKVKTQSGGERPDNADHFVLHDAPQVEAIYGKAPKEIDVIFPSDDLDTVVPTWLKLWGAGARDASGKMISGKLRCKGNGPSDDGTPGEAQWFEKSDPATGVVPTRQCLGDKCPDWLDSKGNKQCKPNMQVFVYLPKVSPFGVFKITTTSWTSIRSFYDHLKWIQNLNGGKIRGILFKLVREQKSFKYTDPKTGKQVDRAQWVMLLKPNENRAEIEGMKQAVNLLTASTLRFEAPPEQLEAAADDVPYIEASAAASAEAAAKVSVAEQLIDDKDVQAYYARIGELLGHEVARKDRIIEARKHEAKAEPKKALLEALGKQGKALADKNKKVTPAVPPTEAIPVSTPTLAPVMEQAPPPVDAGGLI